LALDLAASDRQLPGDARFIQIPMRLTITTWNINSVRLRINGVARFVKTVRPDVLCLQETKCPDDRFPLKRFKRLGYDHVALNGQKGYQTPRLTPSSRTSLPFWKRCGHPPLCDAKTRAE
jgi:Endonuclease/Exonuclease/phosphatase family